MSGSFEYIPPMFRNVERGDKSSSKWWVRGRREDFQSELKFKDFKVFNNSQVAGAELATWFTAQNEELFVQTLDNVEHELSSSLGISDEKFALLRRLQRQAISPCREAAASEADGALRVLRREGKCTHGNRCTFAHGIAQLRPRPDLYKTRLCSSWALLQRCPYGESCTHAHGEEELRTIGDFADPAEVRGLSKEESSTASGDCESELSLTSVLSHFGLPQHKQLSDVVKYAECNAFDREAGYPITTPIEYMPAWGIDLRQDDAFAPANTQVMPFLASHGELLSL
ncbi:CTH1 [Symbiodinium microadriaticum]|nr:CTH1 [Symbiodinium microadriaticum]